MDPEPIRLALLGIIALTLLLFAVPAQCDHGCHACDMERAERIRAAQERQHRDWHGQTRYPDCPWCEERE